MSRALPPGMPYATMSQLLDLLLARPDVPITTHDLARALEPLMYLTADANSGPRVLIDAAWYAGNRNGSGTT